MFWFILQAATQAPVGDETFVDKVLHFLDTPAPYSPFSEYLVVLFLLWLLARRDHQKKDFGAEAQRVLDDKLAKGEIDKVAYEKYRQEISMRLKKE